jgi:hypothetical protein
MVGPFGYLAKKVDSGVLEAGCVVFLGVGVEGCVYGSGESVENGLLVDVEQNGSESRLH